MHEIGIMEETLETARNLMQTRGGSRLMHLHMNIGTLSGVVPEALHSAFLVLKDSYAARDASLHIQTQEALCQCDTCNKPFPFTDNGYLCPECSEPALVVLCGRDLELARIEWE